ncbi:tetrahydromethanopterin:alpha-L-glutamate ligase [Methanococcoides alaskense]|uniref:Tetrahydromethanopterin:alpha-L-glutamate ligase n=1 Tax=Methanococcoides alaskense TaxID=325778 RepID=A0AA90TXK8_9EURY|nr:tetrahydromethanopterin:alpha-L-glutamate ligase [Methanococcoides alaskense]MDA0525180.1 tetrahydromethanopterin:alpha-L-glutamate ligase [Methanococcoides alaskense]MDR6221898.1 tetrahydromethanopterin:alpha-L-glutamate ligase [Methanococcoides alaskense]
MKHIGIIITDQSDPTAQAFQKGCESNNIRPHMIDLRRRNVTVGESLSSQITDIDLQQLDAIIVRDVGAGAFDGVSFRFDVLRQLEQEGVLIVNSPGSIQSAANKYYASSLMAKAGLPIPKTMVFQDTGDALKVIDTLEDAVIKPIFGYKGKDIVRIKDGAIINNDGTINDSDLEGTIDSILEQRGMLHIQEYIVNPGRDIRAFVVNGKVIASIYRTAPEGAWINNLSQGGSESRCELSSQQIELCIKASRSIGTHFAGVDLIEDLNGNDDSDKSLILEINATPSVAGIYKAWGINAAEYIVSDISSEL